MRIIYDFDDKAAEKVLKDYGNKFILRDGDLHAERIDSHTSLNYFYNAHYFDKLNHLGLLFDSYEEAELARTKMLKAIQS